MWTKFFCEIASEDVGNVLVKRGEKCLALW